MARYSYKFKKKVLLAYSNDEQRYQYFYKVVSIPNCSELAK